MRLSTGLLATGAVVYLAGIYGFTTFLPAYRESLDREISALAGEQRLMDVRERRLEEWQIRNTHARWEAALFPAFLMLMGAGMVITGAGGLFYLRDRRLRTDAPN